MLQIAAAFPILVGEVNNAQYVVRLITLCIPVNASASVHWMFLDNALNLIILTIKAASARRINLIQANVRFKIVLRQRNWIKKHANANVEGGRNEIATLQTFMTLKNVNVRNRDKSLTKTTAFDLMVIIKI